MNDNLFFRNEDEKCEHGQWAIGKTQSICYLVRGYFTGSFWIIFSLKLWEVFVQKLPKDK